MDEVEARFALLTAEMEAIQQGIRAFDGFLFQVKGWCVTVAAAIGGVAASTGHARLVWLGVGATVAFWLLDAHYKSVSRVFIRRGLEIEHALAGQKVLEILSSGALTVPGLSGKFQGTIPSGSSPLGRVLREFKWILLEAKQPLTFDLYLFVALCLVLESVLL